MEDLPRSQRLRGKEGVGRLFGEGSRGIAGRVLVRALPNDTGTTRIAAVAGKKLGKAVERNRMRRRLRAAFRTLKKTLPPGWDLALVARTGILESTWPDLTRDVTLAVERAITEGSGPNRSRPNR